MTVPTTCPSCAAACPQGARFCPTCGATLEPAAGRELERKLVSVLFCDLVGFTSLSERVDPEDADRLLREFYTAARRIIAEFYGGLVEKFVGDAVVGVFGAPTAHEDDAERAVRAAIRLRDDIPLLSAETGVELAVRVGVNTGLTVVRHDALRASGEGVLVGDAVNTAARLQQIAPPGGVVVGKTTYELTTAGILYEPLPPARVKGKQAAVPCFVALGPVSRMGVDLRRRFAAPLVDREVESGVLRGLLEKVSASSQPQFALIVGEAGIGKSRLLVEFLRYIDSRPQMVRWRQGRCPSYGDGLAFWALGEILKEQLGVLDTDDGEAIEVELARGLSDLPERDWLMARLRPLLGLSSPPAPREDNYAAWTRFLESLADRPAVLVFEDLHLASKGTLDFLCYLLDHVAPVPLLVVGTARPELLRRSPGTVERLADLIAARRLVRVDLAPLSSAETGELVDSLMGAQASAPETRRAVARRAAGNALYAEQLVRHLQDDSAAPGRRDKGGGSRPLADGALPESLQALITARLDQLPGEEKTVLQDAAVIGQVFWTGAVAALDHGDWKGAQQHLAELAERDLVRPEAASTLAGEPQFAFNHALIRDVAYEQLPRSQRAAKHATVASWIETTTATDEVAEIVAYHYLRALELAEATRDDTLAARLRDAAIEALKRAGDHALGLDVRAAESHYAAAVRLAAGSPRRPYLLVAWADALRQSGRLEEAARALEEGADGLRALGDDEAARVASAATWEAHWLLGDGVTVADDETIGAAGDSELSPERVLVLEDHASRAVHVGQSERAVELATRAIATGDRLRLPESPLALMSLGMARCALGQTAGLADLRRAIEIAQARGTSHLLCSGLSNLGEHLGLFDGPAAALERHRESLDLADRHHDELAVCFSRELMLVDSVWSGRWNEALGEADELQALLIAHKDVWDLLVVRATLGLLSTWRGDHAAAARFAGWAERRSRATPLPAVRAGCLISLASVKAAAGQDAAALRLLRACRPLSAAAGLPDFALRVPEAVRLAIGLGRPRLVEELVAGLPTSRPFDEGTLALADAVLREHRGDHGGAASSFAAAEACWARLRAPYERGCAALGRGRCLMALGQRTAAVAALASAREVFTTLGAAPALRATDAALGTPRRTAT